MDAKEARQIALDTVQRNTPFEIEIVDALTKEESFGWIFFYQRVELPHELVGNAPIIVDRTTGKPSVSGTSYPVEWYLHAYRELGQARFDAREWRGFIEDHYLRKEDDGP